MWTPLKNWSFFDNDECTKIIGTMVFTFLTAIFFPDYGYQGVPWDLYLVHLFFFAIVIPFHVIIFAARNAQTVKPNGVRDWLKGETNSIKDEKATMFPNDFPMA